MAKTILRINGVDVEIKSNLINFKLTESEFDSLSNEPVVKTMEELGVDAATLEDVRKGNILSVVCYGYNDGYGTFRYKDCEESYTRDGFNNASSSAVSDIETATGGTILGGCSFYGACYMGWTDNNKVAFRHN